MDLWDFAAKISSPIATIIAALLVYKSARMVASEFRSNEFWKMEVAAYSSALVAVGEVRSWADTVVAKNDHGPDFFGKTDKDQHLDFSKAHGKLSTALHSGVAIFDEKFFAIVQDYYCEITKLGYTLIDRGVDPDEMFNPDNIYTFAEVVLKLSIDCQGRAQSQVRSVFAKWRTLSGDVTIKAFYER